MNKTELHKYTLSFRYDNGDDFAAPMMFVDDDQAINVAMVFLAWVDRAISVRVINGWGEILGTINK